MEIAAKTTIVLFVFLFAIVAGGILLQVFLSRREGKWPGLVLPVLSCLYALVVAFSAVA